MIATIGLEGCAQFCCSPEVSFVPVEWDRAHIETLIEYDRSECEQVLPVAVVFADREVGSALLAYLANVGGVEAVDGIGGTGVLSIIKDCLSRSAWPPHRQSVIVTDRFAAMDRSLLRIDEMFICVECADGLFDLVGLVEFEGIADDGDLQRSYRDGRFGHVPELV